MITSISLTNFKCFRHALIECADINILAGVNGTGKSTVIQSLLALRQSWDSGNFANNRLQLNGTLVEMGTASEVYCAEPTSDVVELTLASSEPSEVRISSTQTESWSTQYHLDCEVTAGPAIDNFELFHEAFNYLCAERVGPRKAFPIPPDEGHPMRVGRSGENAPFIIASDRRNEVIVNKEVLSAGADGRVYSTLQFQWPLWMARLFPGFDVESEIYLAADQVRLGLGLQRKATGQHLFVRPTNTGFGLSFALGVIVAGLVAKPQTVLIVENPEAHLHPRAQSTMGEFLTRVAAGGTQVFVETHSEHVLNGMRRMIKQKVVAPRQVRVHYFAIKAGVAEQVISRIDVSDVGELSQWPDGFFDQLDRDLSVILS